MGTIICCIIFGFLTILGLADVIMFFAFLLFKKQSSCGLKIIVPLKGHCENLEHIIRSIIFNAAFHKKRRTTEVVCLDCGMDHETRRICETLCENHTNIKIINHNQ